MINIYNKHKFTNDKNLLELIINLYLMESAYRNLFQIIINDKKEKIAKLINIIKKTDYNYEIFETDNYLRLIDNIKENYIQARIYAEYEINN